jgi:2-aminoethylphosphonate transport system permease protein
MLVWSRSGRTLVWTAAGLLIAVIYAAPLLTILAASLAGHWNGLLPSDLTLAHYRESLGGEQADQLKASLATAVLASLVALVAGTWAALALRTAPRLPKRMLDLVFFVPSAVPSVSVGLGLLVAFSQPPVLLNGTVAIVVLAHLVLISAFTYGSVSAGIARLQPDLEQVAASLGAAPSYVLRRITMPLLKPYLLAAFSLSVALSMGELGATVMVYPPGWVTLPVGIFALTDRGSVFLASALTVSLIAVTYLVLIGVSLVPAKAVQR